MTNHPNTLFDPALTLMKARNANSELNITEKYGRPCLVVLEKNLGALPVNASPSVTQNVNYNCHFQTYADLHNARELV